MQRGITQKVTIQEKKKKNLFQLATPKICETKSLTGTTVPLHSKPPNPEAGFIWGKVRKRKKITGLSTNNRILQLILTQSLVSHAVTAIIKAHFLPNKRLGQQRPHLQPVPLRGDISVWETCLEPAARELCPRGLVWIKTGRSISKGGTFAHTKCSFLRSESSRTGPFWRQQISAQPKPKSHQTRGHEENPPEFQTEELLKSHTCGGSEMLFTI